jgi:hypothetical protein
MQFLIKLPVCSLDFQKVSVSASFFPRGVIIEWSFADGKRYGYVEPCFYFAYDSSQPVCVKVSLFTGLQDNRSYAGISDLLDAAENLFVGQFVSCESRVGFVQAAVCAGVAAIVGKFHDASQQNSVADVPLADFVGKGEQFSHLRRVV